VKDEGNVINLSEYRKKKEGNEIDELRRELAELINEMGGIHVMPMMFQASYCGNYLPAVHPPASLAYTDAGVTYDYTCEYDYDGTEK